MRVANPTHYFGEYTKSFNFVPDSNCFSFESSRRQSFQQRLSFEYDYTRLVNGSIFFYTLTYNNKSLHRYLGHPCFSYEDIRYITNGVLSKTLLRHYGSRLRYFCACESGDGKGKRGLGNNPHYHFIFFIQPVHDSDGNPIYKGYKKIDSFHFKKLILDLWQGSSKWIDWRFAKFGHAQPGNNRGEVLNKDCFGYVCKYVTKTSYERSIENHCVKYWYKFISDCFESCGIDFKLLYEYYKYVKEINPLFSARHLYDDFRLHDYWLFRKVDGFQIGLTNWIKYNLPSHGLQLYDSILDWFNSVYRPQFVQNKLSEYKCLYSGKVRCSKSLGIYGLNFIKDVDVNPTIVINASVNGYQVQIPCLYYIRHLYYNIRKCPVTGNPLYVLNDKGIELKSNSLKSSIDSLQSRVKESLSLAVLNDVFYESNESNWSLDLFNSRLDKFLSLDNLDDVVHRYAVYHNVYQFRAYSSTSPVWLDERLCYKDILEDYKQFLRYNLSYLDYEDGKIFDLYYRSPQIVSFSSHPCFQPFVEYFDFLDVLLDCCSRFLSDAHKERFNIKQEHNKRLNQFKFNSADLVRNCLTS